MKLPWRTLLLLTVFAATLFTLDFVLKFWVYTFVFETFPLFKMPFGVDLSLQYVTNVGGAWGVFSTYHETLLFFRIAVIASLLFYLVKICASKRTAFFTTAILVGAVGNVFDCFFYGYVIDMIHFTFWQHSYGVFNLADAWIFFGSFGLMLSCVTGKEVRQNEESKS